MDNKKIIFICIIGSIGIFFLSSLLFNATKTDLVIPNYQDSLNLIVNNYNTKKFQLQNKEDSIIKRIVIINNKLSIQKTKYNSLKDSTLNLIKRMPKECDSLIAYTYRLIEDGVKKDSYFEAKISTQDSLIKAKDNYKVNCEKSFVLLQNTAQETIDLNLSLQAEAQSLNKKLSRNKKAVNFLTIIAVVSTGLIILK